MEKGLITCPKCGHEFELSDALTGQIREHLKGELKQEMLQREEKITSELEKKHAEQLEDINKTLGEKENQINSYKEKEKEIKSREKELDKEKAALEDEIDKRLAEERKKIDEEITKKLESKYSSEVAELKADLENRDKEVENFRKQELELRKKQREADDKIKSVDLEIARKVDEERELIRKEAEGKILEDHRLKDMEKDKLIKDLRNNLEDLKRKSEQGSMETQGEVLEKDFEEQLKSYFPHDDIKPVPKGIRGADIIQTVQTPSGADCGIILWETKNTKSWSSQWIPKLKDDMIEIRATFGILASVVIPDEINRFGELDGVWVSDPLSAIPLATALRHQLIAIERERTASIGKNEKMEALYQYLAGVEFKQKIVGIVEAFTSMQNQINTERRAMEKQWKQREKEIDRIVKNTVGLYGDMQGIIGGQIPVIPELELDGESVKQLTDTTSVEEDDD